MRYSTSMRYLVRKYSVTEAVKKYNADAVFVGSDWKNSDTWNIYEKEFAELGCAVVYLDHTDGISSSIIREKLNELFNA